MRAHVLLDWEVMSVASLDEFVHRGWWQLFDGDAAGMLGCLSRVLGGSADADDATTRTEGGGHDEL
mgnify:CR=1 FL=1